MEVGAILTVVVMDVPENITVMGGEVAVTVTCDITKNILQRKRTAMITKFTYG